MPTAPILDAKAIELPASIKTSLILQEAIELFLAHGFLLIRNAFDPAYVQKLHDEFKAGYGQYFDARTYDDALDLSERRTMVTLKLEGAFNAVDFFAPPKIFPLLEFLLTRKLILASMGCVISLPGSRDQGRHRDYDNIYDPGFSYPGVETLIAKAPPYAITLGLPLVPITELTGCTRFWPGTHLRRAARNDPNLGPGVDFVADLGTCYLFDYRVLHCGIGNKSDIPRPLIYNIYARPWFRDPVNYAKQPPTDVTPEQVFALPERYQRLFSWALVDHLSRTKEPKQGGLCHCGSGLLYRRCHGKAEG
ncbi:MAG: phytanoyl-CoA dioxygenase [Alphaproteobacteria bacterium]|nr:phytanoyl-CoA dioxygenase [Alphaproteobacteria bacterium]